MKKLISTFLIIVPSVLYSQEHKSLHIVETEVDTSSTVYDYFNQEEADFFCEYGRVILMDCSKYWFENKSPQYISKQITYSNGYGILSIYLHNKLLFSYELYKGKIQGIGRIFYPNKEMVAYQAEFKDGKIHGRLFCLNEKGVIFEMRFKKGCPKKLNYLFNVEKSSKQFIQGNRKRNFKGCLSSGLVAYPFKER